MHQLRNTAIAAAMCALAITPAAYAQGSGTDNGFVQFAATGGQAEVQLSQLAEMKATSNDVKMFAARMVKDHTMANQQLQEAVGSSTPLPTRLDTKHQQALANLRHLSGAAFDRAYMEIMVDDHRQAVDQFSHAAGHGTVGTSGRPSVAAPPPKVADFAQRTLPTLQDHLMMAESISKGLKKP
jgi:putative membrane protein